MRIGLLHGRSRLALVPSKKMDLYVDTFPFVVDNSFFLGKRKLGRILLIWLDFQFYFYAKINWYVICCAWVSHKVIWIKFVSLKFHAKMVQRYWFCLWRVLDDQELQPMSTYIGSLHKRSRLPACLLKGNISDCDSIRFRLLWSTDLFGRKSIYTNA